MRRHPNRVTENVGINTVRQLCEAENVIFQAEPREDYGIDCYVEVVRDDQPLNFIVGLQVKCGPSYRREAKSRPGTFRVYADQRHIDYWIISNLPVLFVYVGDDGAIWWHHVSNYLDQKEMLPSEFKYFEFDAVPREPFGGYLRHLQSVTPSADTRLRVAACKTPEIRVNGEGLSLTADEIGPKCRALAVKEEFDLGLTSVLGASADGRWVGFWHTWQIGMKCEDRWFILYDRERSGCFKLPVWIERDHDDDIDHLPQFDSTLASRLANIEKKVREASLQGVVHLPVDEYDPFGERPHSDVTLSFDGIEFAIEVDRSALRSELILVTRGFVPRRRLRLVAQAAKPAPYYADESVSEASENPWGLSKQFDHLAGIYISRSASLVTFVIGTNEENQRDGNVDYEFFHTSVAELRQSCIEMLRR